MKQYPHISKEIRQDLYIYAFDKLDGTNIRAEWNSKKGFYKFGTRTQLIDKKTLPFGQSISLIKENFEKDLTVIFKNQQWKDAVCFFEYYGDESFAGSHNFNAEMNLSLIDVNPCKQGILIPSEFIKLFGHLDVPLLCYEGLITTELFDKIKNRTLTGMTFEGVVAKGQEINGNLVMFKIKSKDWLNKLKDFCKNDQKLFERLS